MVVATLVRLRDPNTPNDYAGGLLAWPDRTTAGRPRPASVRDKRIYPASGSTHAARREVWQVLRGDHEVVVVVQDHESA